MATFQRRKHMLFVGIGVLMPIFSILAQQYSLQNLVDASKNYLPVLKQKQAQVNSAKASVTDTRHSFLPQVRASEQLSIASVNSIAGSYFNFIPTASTSGGVRAASDLQPNSSNLAALYGEYELANFGLNDAKLQTAQANVGLQQADLERERYAAELEVARYYFNMLKTQYRLATDQQNVKRYDSIFTIIKALTISGLKPGSDSSLAKAELSKARITYNQTAGSLSQLKEQLSYLTGIPSQQLLIDSLAGNFLMQKPLPLNFAFDTANNPLIDYYAKRKDILLANEILIKKSYLPKVILAAGTWARGSNIQYNDDYKSLATGLGYQRFNYAIGIGITYNLFNGLYRKDKLDINHFDTQASEFALQQEKQSLYSASLRADAALQATQANLAELPIQLGSATDTYKQKLAQYKAGIISLIDLTNASFVLYRSQTDYIETLNDWYLAQLDKAASTGNLTQFIQTIK